MWVSREFPRHSGNDRCSLSQHLKLIVWLETSVTRIEAFSPRNLENKIIYLKCLISPPDEAMRHVASQARSKYSHPFSPRLYRTRYFRILRWSVVRVCQSRLLAITYIGNGIRTRCGRSRNGIFVSGTGLT